MHIEFDELTLLALGEERREASAHLAGCASCQEQLAELRAVVGKVRETGPVEPVPAEHMPAELWSRIAAEAGVETGVDDAEVTPIQAATGRRTREDDTSDRAFSRYLIGIAAAAGIGIGTIATTYFSDRGPAGELIASAELEALADDLPTASAEVIERDGRQFLVIETDQLADPQGGYLEVWLLNEDVSGLITLGPLDADRQEFVIPSDLDLSEFPIVDISREHFDGDPTHSADSLWRGGLALGEQSDTTNNG